MDTPDLFPGLTAADRAKLAQIAGNLETLPQLLDRLAGFSVALERARAATPAIVMPRGPTQNFELLQVVPQTSDERGYQRVRQRRTLNLIGNLVIRAGQQDGDVLLNPVTSGQLTIEDFGGGMAIFDDPTRVEAVVLQMSIDGGTTFWNAQNGTFSGAFNSTAGLNAPAQTWALIGSHLRMRATAVAVAADRTFPLYAFSM